MGATREEKNATDAGFGARRLGADTFEGTGTAGEAVGGGFAAARFLVGGGTLRSERRPPGMCSVIKPSPWVNLPPCSLVQAVRQTVANSAAPYSFVLHARKAQQSTSA